MRLLRRIRPVWIGYAIAASLILWWIAGIWYVVSWESPRGSFVIVGSGEVIVGYNTPNRLAPTAGWNLWRIHHQHRFIFNIAPYGSGSRGGGNWWRASSVPLPGAAVLIAGASWFISWLLQTMRRRRRLAGQCLVCHYNRTGLAADAPCPECGTAP